MHYRKNTAAVCLALTAALLSGCSKDIPGNAVPAAGTNISDTAPPELSSADDVYFDLTLSAAETTPAEDVKSPDPAQVHEKLDDIRKKYGVYGMGAAFFRDGEIIFTDSFGVADTESERPVTEKTKFRAASVSKLVSTIPVMSLIDKGIYDLDGSLSEQTGLPYDADGGNDVKLWHLLTHTAGLIDTYEYEVLCFRGKYSTEKILENAHSGAAPGTFYNYCNFGAGTMGSIVERLTGEFFHSYADKVMFSPLGMDAAYLVDLLDEPEECAYIYDTDGEIFRVPTWGRTSTYYESFGLGNSYLTAQCELLISASDLARIGTALAGDGTAGDVRLLSEKSTELMHKNYFQTEKFGMGLNVRIYDGNLVEGRTIYGHPGQALGAVCGLYYDRSDRTGVAVLTNRCVAAVNSDNGVYSFLDEIINTAYDEFF